MNAAPVFPFISKAPRSGLVHLRNEVERYFAAHDVPASVAPVGLKYRSFALNQMAGTNANRIVFIPGAFAGAPTPLRAYGALSRETVNSASVVNPREIAQWARLVTVSVWAAPKPGAVEDEQTATALAEDLLEQTVRAIESAVVDDVNVAASIEWGSLTLNTSGDSFFGAELLLQFVMQSPLFDVTLDTVQTLVAANRGPVE